PLTWEAAEDPKPSDVVIFDTDYILAPGDVIRVYIYELLGENLVFTRNYIVTESGKISISEIGTIQAAGLSESQLEEEIKQILSPSILKEPSVTVTLTESTGRTFSISGDGVRRPNRYQIPRHKFRLLDALAMSGGISQFNISHIYVTRAVTGKEAIAEPTEHQQSQNQPEELIVPEQELLEVVTPRVQRQVYKSGFVITSTEMVTEKELTDIALPEGFELSYDDEKKQTEDDDALADALKDLEGVLETSGEPVSRETIEEPLSNLEAERIEWIFQDGKWIPIQHGQPKVTRPAIKTAPEKITGQLKEQLPEDFDWDQIGTGGLQARVIKIPADKLAGGDPRYNIAIRPGDTIQVPVDIIGEYFIYGNSNRQGAVPLTGRPLTLKMAVAAAGGLGPLAWPKRCEVTRRIGDNKEETVMVDLEKIASGEQPDFFIKPLDLINVGTHPTSRWRAVLRNAFRATYGFGFIYDRNFADRDSRTSRPLPNWF
ncbi:MAG: polysaccharide biosynthesis/export family protein, partial [Planctomycetes bacterium]|nr:polysaccharide biosynthesis/export family protein [Planctomycetota bacterium]